MPHLEEPDLYLQVLRTFLARSESGCSYRAEREPKGDRLSRGRDSRDAQAADVQAKAECPVIARPTMGDWTVSVPS